MNHVLSNNMVSPSAKISPLAHIEQSIRGSSIVICDGVNIDSFVKIKVAGGSGDLYIGDNSYINSGCVIYTGNGVKIGKDVLIASNCTIAATNHEISDVSTPIRLQGFAKSKGGILIEDDVWIGCNVAILDGAIIRTGCVIAAGSVVRTEIPSYSIFAGNPGKVICLRR